MVPRTQKWGGDPLAAAQIWAPPPLGMFLAASLTGKNKQLNCVKEKDNIEFLHWIKLVFRLLSLVCFVSPGARYSVFVFVDYS